MDKFILASNPLRDGSREWIVHLLQPVAIIEVFGPNDPPIKEGQPSAEFGRRRRDNLTDFYRLRVHHFFTTDFISEADDQAAPLLKKAWHWYRAYLDQMEENEKSINN